MTGTVAMREKCRCNICGRSATAIVIDSGVFAGGRIVVCDCVPLDPGFAIGPSRPPARARLVGLDGGRR